jgi:hypothetical protein
VAGYCEGGDEPSGSISAGNFLSSLGSQEGLCFVEVAS